MSRTKRRVHPFWKTRPNSVELTSIGLAKAGVLCYAYRVDPRDCYVTCRDRKSKKSSRNTVRNKHYNNRKERYSYRRIIAEQMEN